MGHPYWPIFDIVVRTPRLELRLPSDTELVDLISAARDVTDTPGVFHSDWATLRDPTFSQRIAQFQWKCRALWTPDDWHLPLCAFADQTLVGSQGVQAKNFGVIREIATGSWLRRTSQGAGLGTEMRAAVLHLAFAGLGAEVARSSARVGNEASLKVSDALGYQNNGTARTVFADGEVDTEILLALDRRTWEKARRSDIEISGLGGCIELFGVDSSTP